VLTAVFSTVLRRWEHRHRSPEEHEAEFKRYEKGDVPRLQNAYMYAFAVQSTVHIATMAYASTHPGISILKAFFELPNPFQADWNIASVSQQVATCLRYDAVTALAGYLGGQSVFCLGSPSAWIHQHPQCVERCPWGRGRPVPRGPGSHMGCIVVLS
jgi:hypothetical protein